MKNKILKKVNHIINRAQFKIAYIIANTFMVKKIEKGNNYFNIMTDEELIDEIINHKKSFSRFGDGELSLILENKFNISFQTNSKELSKELKKVLNSNEKNLILGINRSFNSPNEYNEKVIKYCRAFNYLYREKYKTIIPNEKKYGNSSITRFYIDYDTNDKESAKKRINNLKRIWENRKILIVEGDKTKLGVGNDLFFNTKRIRRIIVPSINAYDKKNEIVLSVQKNIEKEELVLLAVGPTATILAYDLAKSNIQAVDIGHIDIEYEWMLAGVNKRTAVPGKYVNEIKGKKYSEISQTDEHYKNSIIAKIK